MSAAWTLGLLAGVNLLTSGVAIMMMAFAARSVVETVRGFHCNGARVTISPKPKAKVRRLAALLE